MLDFFEETDCGQVRIIPNRGKVMQRRIGYVDGSEVPLPFGRRSRTKYLRHFFSSGRLRDLDIASKAAGDIVEISSALVEIR